MVRMTTMYDGFVLVSFVNTNCSFGIRLKQPLNEKND